MKHFLVPALLLSGAVTAQAEPRDPTAPQLPAGYHIDTIKLPRDTGFGITGVDQAADGSIYVCIRESEVWRLSPERTWSLFATGLHEPCGLMIDEDGSILIAQKPEVTRLRDTDGDGVADVYEPLTHSQWALTYNYHFFHFGFVRDKQHRLWGTLNVGFGGKGAKYPGSPGNSNGGYRGWAYSLADDGTWTPECLGLRSPCGLGLHANGEVFYTDNQGDWMPTSQLAQLIPGKFYGHPVSLQDLPEYTQEQMQALSVEEINAMRQMPAIFFPHEQVAGSPGNFERDASQGAFGPFAGQYFMGDQRYNSVCRFDLEQVNGHWQGWCTTFINGLNAGVVRVTFDQDQASLWTGQTSRGWGGDNSSVGLQRVVYDGKSVPATVHSATLEEDGFTVHFTQPVRTDIQAHVTSWWYNFWPKYGSPPEAVKTFDNATTTLSEDGLSCRITCPIEAKRVYQLSFPGLKTTAGKPLDPWTLWYTVIETR